MRTLLSVFVLLLMTVPPFMNVTAVPDTPDFDESGIRTTQDFKDMGDSDVVTLRSTSDCAIKWFYDDDNVNPAAEVHLKVMGSYYGTQTSTASLSIYIYNSNNAEPVLKNSIVPHEYFANTAGLSNAPQWTYIPLGTRESLGIKGDEWNSIILTDTSTIYTENVKIRVDWNWPDVYNWAGTSYGIQHSYYSANMPDTSTCLERSKNHYPDTTYYQDELMIMLEYSRAFSSSIRDDGSREDYVLIDSTDDKVEKKLWVSAPAYTTWNILYMKAASVGSASPPWSPGLLKLKTCKVPHDDYGNCAIYPFEMTLRAQFFVFGYEQWGFEYVPSSAFPVEGNYYFLIKKTSTDYTKENVQISLSTQSCSNPYCYSRWLWNDGPPPSGTHGTFTYGQDQGELMIRFKPIRQWDDGPTFKEYTVLGPTLYMDPVEDLYPDGPNTIDSRLQTAGWKRTAYYKNVGGAQVKKEYYYGENYGGSSTSPLQNAGDDSDFIFINAHGSEGFIDFADGISYDGYDGQDFDKSSGFNGDAEWVVTTSCDFTKHKNPSNSNYLVMHYSKLHSLHGFKEEVPNDDETDVTFANALMDELLNNNNYIYMAFSNAADDIYDDDLDRSYIRVANQNDKFWGEGTVTGDTITGTWDIQTIEYD